MSVTRTQKLGTAAWAVLPLPVLLTVDSFAGFWLNLGGLALLGAALAAPKDTLGTKGST